MSQVIGGCQITLAHIDALADFLEAPREPIDLVVSEARRFRGYVSEFVTTRFVPMRARVLTPNPRPRKLWTV